MKLTGDPSRSVSLGLSMSPDGSPKSLFYAFDEFKFPACGSCNKIYSKLEDQTKIIFTKMFASQPLTAHELHILLDWLDKVRIGLWLAYFYLDHNVAGIQPHFFIGSRIGLEDRMIEIYRSDYDGKGLSFICANTPAFKMLPSAFTLVVNNLFLLNVSYNFYLSRRMGLPFPRKVAFMDDGRWAIDPEEGLKRKINPIVRDSFQPRGIQILQPIFGRYKAIPGARAYYENDYVRAHSMDFDRGIGKIFLAHERSVSEYPEDPSALWLPHEAQSHYSFANKICIRTAELQSRLVEEGPSLDKLSEEKRRAMKNHIKLNKRFTRLMVKAIKQSRLVY